VPAAQSTNTGKCWSNADVMVAYNPCSSLHSTVTFTWDLAKMGIYL
jgi:hypothetical protein